MPNDKSTDQLLVVLLLLSLESLIIFSTATVSHCNDKDPKFPKTMIYNSTSCYFTLKNDDLGRARHLCHDNDGTLPSIRSKEENQFLVENIFKGQESIKAIILGLQKAKNFYVWDDKSPITYEHPQWNKITKWPVHVYTLLTEVGWTDVDKHNLSLFTKNMPIVCKQAYFEPLPPIANPIPGIKCFGELKSKYPLTFIYAEAVCYFVVPDANDFAIVNTSISKVQNFYIDRARYICTMHNATLPILRNKDEESFLLDTFYSAQNNYSSINRIGDGANEIALGLRQINASGEYQYQWDDETDLTYQHAIWNRRQYPPFTVLRSALNMKNDKHWWLDTMDVRVGFEPLHVICRQQFAEAKTVTRTTTKISTTTLEPARIKCNMLDKKTFTKVVVFANSGCYFLADTASTSLQANQIQIAGNATRRNYVFQMSIARWFCNNTYIESTLPVIHSEEEARFVMKSFSNKEHDPRDELAQPIKGVALGMIGEKGNYYYWQDGSELSYVPKPNWDNTNDSHGKFMYAYMTGGVYEDGADAPIVWRVVRQTVHAEPRAVICKLKLPGAQTTTAETKTGERGITDPRQVVETQPSKAVKLGTASVIEIASLALAIAKIRA